MAGAVESSTRPELEAEDGGASHPRSIESSRKEASNTSSSSTMQVLSSTAGQGQGVLLPVSCSSPPPLIEVRSSVPVRDEAAGDDTRR